MTPRAGQIEGPAKWAAVAVLGGAGLLGVGRSLFVDTVHAPPAQPIAEPVRIEPMQIDRRTSEPNPEQVPAASTRSNSAATSTPPDAPKPISIDDGVAVRINVNTASAAELDLLPGIGQVYAERIVAERSANGSFTSIRDLQRVRGIGPKTAAKLGPLVSFEQP